MQILSLVSFILFSISPITGDQQRVPMATAQTMQMNQIQTPIQQIDIKTEHQTQQKQTIQVVRPQNVNQPFMAQSLPPNNVNVNANINQANANVNVNVNMDQMAADTGDDDSLSNTGSNSQAARNNQKMIERMRQDEGELGNKKFDGVKSLLIWVLSSLFTFIVLNEYATISSVLYVNTNHPEFKVDYPNWTERCKQILKKWRTLPAEKRAPYLQKAKENRSCLKKAQQVSI